MKRRLTIAATVIVASLAAVSGVAAVAYALMPPEQSSGATTLQPIEIAPPPPGPAPTSTPRPTRTPVVVKPAPPHDVGDDHGGDRSGTGGGSDDSSGRGGGDD